MHFERSLQRAIYAPWKPKYIDYSKLKNLLRDTGSDAGAVALRDDEDEWTEADEGAFVEELVNVQLEKVHAFQAETIQKLRERTSSCEAKLDPLVSKEKNDEEVQLGEISKQTMQNVLQELDGITKEMNELEKFSRINYTGFLKATKKHDRKRGHSYRVGPLMQVRLAALPFNKENYSPLLFRLSTMYSFIRQNLDGKSKAVSFAEYPTNSEKFTSHKFWVHPDNLLELKTVILRRLPVLIYNPQTSKVAEGGQRDPTITSIYFDNPKFSLYNNKVDHSSEASSLRLRWYGQLVENPEIYVEKKTVLDDHDSEEQRFTTKIKYVQPFLRGEYKMDKDTNKLVDKFGADSEQATGYQKTVNDIQEFVTTNELQPVLRANYTRTAFQIPGDNRVRITLDTDLALIREDALDLERPCRDPDEWHRKEIDDAEMEYPFSRIRKGEVQRFPFAVLEIRTRSGRDYEWVSEIMDSHLVKTAPRFSKFVHGVAQLFDEFVNSFPFWLSEAATDIRRDPHQAFEEEQEKKAKAAEDEVAVGSLLKTRSSKDFRASITSPLGSPKSTPRSAPKNQTPLRATPEMTKNAKSASKTGREAVVEEEDSDDDGVEVRDSTGFSALIPSFSKYARAKRQGRVNLPAGVSEPSFWIKDEGPNKVEAKVWLANQRTFIKWQHVSILLASLSLALYNAAGKHNNIARALGIAYTLISVFTALWGYGIYMYRNRLIQERSPKDFDNFIGPAVVCIGLIVALLLNFGFQYRAVIDSHKSNTTAPLIGNVFVSQGN